MEKVSELSFMEGKWHEVEIIFLHTKQPKSVCIYSVQSEGKVRAKRGQREVNLT